MGEKTLPTAPLLSPMRVPRRQVGTGRRPAARQRSVEADGSVQRPLVGAGPPRRRTPTARRGRRLVGTPSPHRPAVALMSEASPAGLPVAPGMNAATITPTRGRKVAGDSSGPEIGRGD